MLLTLKAFSRGHRQVRAMAILLYKTLPRCYAVGAMLRYSLDDPCTNNITSTCTLRYC